MEKTNKQKCLEQWIWLRDNPGKSKTDYFRDVLGFNDKEIFDADEEYNLCFACKVAFNNDCENCPIEWYKGYKGENPSCECEDFESPYYKWYYIYFENYDYNRAASCANQICVLIENTWKDD